MSVMKYKDPTTGEVKKVGAPKIDAYTKTETDTLLQNKADLDEYGKVPAEQVDAYSQSESISASTRTALSLPETATPDAALAEIARQLSESWGLKLTKLWENASPSSEFSPQNVSVENMSNHKFICVKYSSNERDSEHLYSPLVDTSHEGISTTHIADTIYRCFISRPSSGVIQFFGACKGTSANSNTALIPLVIYGVDGITVQDT